VNLPTIDVSSTNPQLKINKGAIDFRLKVSNWVMLLAE